MKPLYHLAPLDAWVRFLESGSQSWEPPSLATEGFVHLSFADQVAESVRKHFADVPEVAVIEVDQETVASDLRLEPSRGGALFPHVYRALRPTDVVTWRRHGEAE